MQIVQSQESPVFPDLPIGKACPVCLNSEIDWF